MGTYVIDRESDTPLYIQIRESIQAAIASGQLRPGDKLPAVAALAKEIGVTQATIRRALRDLGEAGHTTCHVGRGTFILDAEAPDGKSRDPVDPGPDELDLGRRRQGGMPRRIETNPLEFAARRLRSGVSKALFDIMPLAHKEGIIQLTKGVPDPSELPERFLEEVTQETLADDGYVSPALAMWLPNLVFLPLGILMVRRISSQVATARAGGWDDLTFTLVSFLKRPFSRASGAEGE